MLKVASDFAMEDFQEFDMDAYDAVCELINCTNGAFATRLCDDDIDWYYIHRYFMIMSYYK